MSSFAKLYEFIEASKYLIPHCFVSGTIACGVFAWSSFAAIVNNNNRNSNNNGLLLSFFGGKWQRIVAFAAAAAFGGIIGSFLTLRLACDQKAFLSDPPSPPFLLLNDNNKNEKNEKNEKKEKKEKKIGVLHINLGTPASSSPSDVGNFLSNFLCDRRVVESPRILWWITLNLFILPIRCFTSAILYSRVIEKNEQPPLLRYSRLLTAKLQNILTSSSSSSSSSSNNDNTDYDSEIHVQLGLIASKPSVEDAIIQLKQKGIDKILVFSAFPQYSGTTTASVYETVFKVAAKYRNVPTLRFIPPYYDHPSYISAIIDTVHETITKQNFKAYDHLLFSFHGIPLKYVERGDPYEKHCQTTAALVAQGLSLTYSEENNNGNSNSNVATTWSLSFQSQFGYSKWLKPATNDHIEYLAKHKNIKRLLVVCPGFLVDCLETIDEIGSEAKKIFLHSGGIDYCLVPCLNDSDVGIHALKNIILEEGSGWL